MLDHSANLFLSGVSVASATVQHRSNKTKQKTLLGASRATSNFNFRSYSVSVMERYQRPGPCLFYVILSNRDARRCWCYYGGSAEAGASGSSVIVWCQLTGTNSTSRVREVWNLRQRWKQGRCSLAAQHINHHADGVPDRDLNLAGIEMLFSRQRVSEYRTTV